MHRKILLAILVSFLFHAENCLADSQNADTERYVRIASRTIANAAKKLTTGKTFNVSMNWGENAEIIVVRTLSASKRVAVIYNVINFLEENDEVIFDKLKTNEHQLAASILTRLRALLYLGELIGATENEMVVKDYIDGEVSDLKLVLARRIPYGTYYSARKMRDDKRLMLLMSDKDFVVELLNIDAKKDPLPKTVANVTTMIAFSDICVANLENLCIKL